MATFELKSNTSKANIDKYKKKLFLYFDNSNRNQTYKKTFSYNFDINKNLKKTDEKKCFFKCV